MTKEKPNKKGLKIAAIKSVSILPTMITLGNMLCGFAAIFFAFQPEEAKFMFEWKPVEVGCWLIFLGMALDALDGRVARMTKATSELGAQLDSLSDMVTFGVAPAFLLIQQVGIEGVPFLGAGEHDMMMERAIFMIAACYASCAALRLARFNVEHNEESEEEVEDGHMYFKGLPSPGAAGTVAGLIIASQWLSRQASFPAYVEEVVALVLIILALLTAVAMISNFRYVHVMNRYLKGKAPFYLVATMVILAFPLVTYFHLSIAALFSLYALSAPVIFILKIWKIKLPKSPLDDEIEPAKVDE